MMRHLRAWMIRFGGLFHQHERDRQLAMELESHLEMDIEDGVRSGLTDDEARRQAVLKLGGIEATKERYRDRRGIPLLDQLGRDLRYAVRALRRRPGFTLASIVVLALGIGANTAIFSVVHAVLLAPLPYEDPGRLVFVWHTPPQSGFPGLSRFAVSPANYFDWKAQSRAFERMAIIRFRPFNLTGTEQPETLRGAAVSADFFPVLGVEPILGRTFVPEEDRPGARRVVVLSEGLWTRRFGADRHIVGRSISLDGQPSTVIGVMGAAVRLPDWAQLWTPLAWTEQQRAVRSNHNAMVIARLAPAMSLTQAQVEMSTISRRLEQQYPEDNKGWGALVQPMHEGIVEDIRTPLLVLLGAVAFVLLIACANVANLVLARTVARRKEIGVRIALGASGGRVLRQVLCETTLLGVAGGVAGLLVARAGVDLIVAFLGDALPEGTHIGLDIPVLAFTLMVSVATGILAGLGAGWRLTRTNVSDALKQGLGHTDADGGGRRTRTVLVVSEVALSLVLLIGAGLMIRSLWRLSHVDPGFDSRNVLTVRLPIPENKYTGPEQQIRFYTDVLERVRRMPGVQGAGVSSTLPMNGDGNNWPIAVVGRPAPPAAEQPQVQAIVASPGVLRALGVPVVRGRDISETDVSASPRVVLVSEAMARHFWPNADPLGQRVTTIFKPGDTFEVVGVVRDMKLDGLDVGRPVEAMYLPFAQDPLPGMALLIRTGTSPAGLVPSVTAAVHAIDRDQPLVEIRTMDDIMSRSMAERRFTMLLLASFAGLALVLAAVGIYSVLSYTVRQRVREIGIRLALGARPREVLRLIVLNGMRPTAAGVAVGLAGAAILSRVLSSSVYEVSGTDPITFAGVSIVLLTVGLCASLIPAYRATRIDPIRTLRDE
jgi:putative ABC transport system permease protein